jgi:hypothetical protein
MKSNAKVNKSKVAKNSAMNIKTLDQDKAIVVNAESNIKRKKVENSAINMNSSDQDKDSFNGEEGRNDSWMLRYDINEKGIGKILLPPSLSTLLQSDRVFISPAAGGLFIRSV